MSKQNTYIDRIVTTKKAFLSVGLAGFMLLSFGAVRQVSAASTDESTDEHLVTVYDGDFEKTFISTKNTVAAALKAEGVSLEPADRVEPAADTELVAGSYSVNVYRARPVTIVDGNKQMNVLTSSQSPKQVVKDADTELYPEDETDYVQSIDPLSDGGTGLKLVIDRATPFQMTLYGKKTTARTQMTTVGEMLAEKDIELGPKDGMSVKSDQKLVKGMKVNIWRNGKQTVTEEQVIKKPIQEINDADRDIGYRSVKTPGKNGTKDVTYEIELRNGKEVSRKKISSNVTKQPVKEVVVVGTKTAMVKVSGSCGDWISGAGISDTTNANYLIQKESGCNPNAVNPSSGACGVAQEVPCGKSGCSLGDGACQVKWMNGYVESRYGSWAGAVAHSRANGWY